jgi:hypothetical protein
LLAHDCCQLAMINIFDISDSRRHDKVGGISAFILLF